jgi:fibronectin-binding autotransporter adhesin
MGHACGAVSLHPYPVFSEPSAPGEIIMPRFFPTSPSSRVRRSRRALRLACEPLEARQLLSSFTVNEFNVDNATTTGSLRWAITQATATQGNNTVTFDPTVFNVPRTITLTAGQLSLTDDNPSGAVTVAGPGANLLTVNANHTSRVFNQQAGNAALSGLTITGGSAGTSGGGLYSLSGGMTLSNVTISGNSATDNGGGISFGDSSATLTNVTVSGNTAFNGGGLYMSNGKQTLTNVTVSGNSAFRGGGLFMDGGTSTLSNVTVRGNSAEYGGGLGASGTTTTSTLSNLIVSGNSASRNGGGIYNYGSTMSLTNVTVSGNSATGTGGGLYLDTGTATLSNDTVSGNSASSGGGLQLDNATTMLSNDSVSGNSASTAGGGLGFSSGTSTLTDVIVSGNSAVEGGGLYIDGATTNLSNDSVSGNTASGNTASHSSGSSGGGLFIRGGAQALTDVTISGNTAFEGGGLYINGATTTLSNDSVSGNSAEYGGGLYINGGTTTLNNGTVSGNNTFSSSGSDGGGLYIRGGKETLTNVTVSGNSASGGGGLSIKFGAVTLSNDSVSGNSGKYGGGLLIYGGTTTLSNLTVSGNSASQIGGGLYISGGKETLTNVTISGNSAAARGGGASVSATAVTLTLTDVTVSANSAPGASGLDLDTIGSEATLTNTIVAGNSGGADISGSYTSTNDLIGGNPLLAPLGDYGGPALTMPPLSGSPAIGGGTSTGTPTTDQRGFARSAPVDIGADQHQTATTLVVAVTGDAGAPAGEFDLRGAVNVADIQQGPQTITFASTVFNTPQTITLTAGQLVLNDPTLTTITGPGANLLTVSGNDASRVFDVEGGSATISGLTITGGSAQSGGGLYNSGGNLSLTNVTISGNSAISGGGLFNHGAASLTDVTVSGNSATYGGGLFSNRPSTLSDVTVSGNSARFGGGIYNYGSTMSLTNVTVSGNSATSTGGGLRNYHGTTSLTNTIVAGNTVGGDIFGSYSGTHNLVGGNPMLAPLGDYGGPTFTMPPLPGSPAINAGTGSGTPATDQRGFARDGLHDIGADEAGIPMVVNTTTGGIGSLPGRLSLPQAINLANVLPTADTIMFAPSVFITPQTITLSAGQLMLTDMATTTIIGPGANLLTVSGNHASRVFDINGGPAALSGLTITGGSASSGGGLYNSSSNLSLTNVTVSGNSAISGGGLFNSGTATLTDVTVSGNSATYGGGLFSDGPSTLTNVTVSGNSASENGGGIYNYGSTMSLTNVTVSGNSATSTGGGLKNNRGTTSLTNTIVAGNTVGGDVFGSYSGTNNLVGGNPLLAPLGYYGGSTQTMPLLPGSPAIGGGTATGAPTTDQRGVARTGRVDIGAFQSQGFNVAITGGNNQSTSVGTSFPSPLSVTVSSAHGEPVAGGVVTFTGPASGASATFTCNPAVIGTNGSTSIGATANGTSGTYAVSASTGAGSASFTLTNSAKQALAKLDVATISDVAENIQFGNRPNVAVEQNANDPVSAGDSADLVVGGLGQHTIQLGNGNDILIDGSATVVNAGDSLRQILSDWNASPSASVNTRLKVVYNTIHPNVLKTGSGRDWFFYGAPTTSNKKSTDRLN